MAQVACGGEARQEQQSTAPAGSGGEAVLAPSSTMEMGSVPAAIAGAHRSPEDRARDADRHPAETLAFFGLEPSMKVVEMGPGAGWYTDILAPVVHDEGQLTVAISDPAQSEYSQRLLAHFGEHPAVFDRVEQVIFDPAANGSLGPDGTADMVLTFRSTHGWINNEQAQAVYAAMFRVLRPGGVLGVVQHRAADDADPAASAETGYVPEPFVVELATNAGFVLEESSPINRNARDDHDHPEGVWTLPPNLRLGDQDRAQYEAIGESDRMTLRFRKPTAPSAG